VTHLHDLTPDELFEGQAVAYCLYEAALGRATGIISTAWYAVYMQYIHEIERRASNGEVA